MAIESKKVKLTCAECGVGFSLYPSQMGRDRGKYCSRACTGKAKRHGSELHCALCDTAFYRRFGEQDVGERVNQFCSRQCYMDWRAMHRSPDTYIKDGRRHAHRVVAEAVLGRALRAREVVHHIDGDKHNNHPSNLAVFPDQSYHARCHFGEMSDDELRGFSLSQAATRYGGRL